MNRKIEIEFPEAEIKVYATLRDNEEPEMCDRLWEILEKPVRMANAHTVSTGCFFDARPRPPKHAVKVGTQAKNIGRKKSLYCDLEPGTVLYSGYEIGICYGDHITEPLTTSGTFVAEVDKENMDDLYKAGKFVWNAQYFTHLLTTTIVSRKEG